MVLVSLGLGDTHVICTASFENDVPPWLKHKREASKGKQSGRTVEIQRLIGRSLRTILDLKKIKGSQFILDCDVIQADGGTRTASISGAFVALSLAVKKLLKNNSLKENPIKDYISAISCGIVNKEVFVDLDYNEDSKAEVDANFIFSKNSGIAEVQVSGEGGTFKTEDLNKMLQMSESSVKKIFEIQEKVLS